MPDPIPSAGLSRPILPAPEPDPGAPPREAAVRAAAEAFEASFLAEMLRHTGLAEPPEQFGGGPGEARFAGLLVREYAEALAARGGVGLGDRIARSLLARDGGTG